MTKIEWTHRPGTTGVTWNPVSGCDPDDGYQSEACVNCWARRMSKRLAGRHVSTILAQIRTDGTCAMTDWDIVQNALEHAHSTATGLRYYGMQKLYQETAEALDALRRLKQPSFWDGWGEDEASRTNRHESG